jgi:SPOR domain
MLTASSSRPTLTIVAAATALGVVIGTVTAFVVGGTESRGDARLARSPAVTATTLPEEFYTVVLASIAAAGEDSQAAADQRARQLRDRGIEVGLLNSSDYGSLKQGYLVVYSGRFKSEGAAQRHLEQLRAAGLPPGPNPYVREVSDPKR